MIVLDASVLIAHLSPHDAHHQAATAILVESRPGSMLIHSVTLAEVLVGGARIGQASAMQDDVFAAGIRLAQHDVDESLRLAELRVARGLKLPDCCVLDVAMRQAASLATFDASLAAAARRLDVPVV